MSFGAPVLFFSAWRRRVDSAHLTETGYRSQRLPRMPSLAEGVKASSEITKSESTNSETKIPFDFT